MDILRKYMKHSVIKNSAVAKSQYVWRKCTVFYGVQPLPRIGREVVGVVWPRLIWSLRALCILTA